MRDGPVKGRPAASDDSRWVRYKYRAPRVVLCWCGRANESSRLVPEPNNAESTFAGSMQDEEAAARGLGRAGVVGGWWSAAQLLRWRRGRLCKVAPLSSFTARGTAARLFVLSLAARVLEGFFPLKHAGKAGEAAAGTAHCRPVRRTLWTTTTTRECRVSLLEKERPFLSFGSRRTG